jgi:vesicular inhibitory amino acid transporter
MPQTVFNLVNVIMGAGYVSIPFALKQGGWVALAVLWLLGAFFCYTGLALLECCRSIEQQQQQQHQQHQRDQSSRSSSSTVAGLPKTAPAAAGGSEPPAAAAAAAAGAKGGGSSYQYTAGYEDVAAAAFGPLGKVAVSAIMYAELLGICCVYVTLEVRPYNLKTAYVVHLVVFRTIYQV